jgi:hypothetical protein
MLAGALVSVASTSIGMAWMVRDFDVFLLGRYHGALGDVPG